MLLKFVGSPRSLKIGHVHRAIVCVRQSEHYALYWALEAMVRDFPDQNNQYRLNLHY